MTQTDPLYDVPCDEACELAKESAAVKPQALTNRQKRALAELVLDAIANLTEFSVEELSNRLDSGINLDLDGVDGEAITTQLGIWAARLPTGDLWDNRLTYPGVQ